MPRISIMTRQRECRWWTSHLLSSLVRRVAATCPARSEIRIFGFLWLYDSSRVERVRFTVLLTQWLTSRQTRARPSTLANAEGTAPPAAPHARVLASIESTFTIVERPVSGLCDSTLLHSATHDHDDVRCAPNGTRPKAGQEGYCREAMDQPPPPPCASIFTAHRT